MKLSRKVLSIAPDCMSPAFPSSGAHEGDVAAPSGEDGETSLPAPIPADVMAAAIRALHSDEWDTPEIVIARAILAERERCAVFVECMTAGHGYAGGQARSNLVKRTNPSFTAQVLAAAIRAGA